VRPIDPPAPLRLSARQLSYLHSGLLLDLNLGRAKGADEKSLKLIEECWSAVHQVMREWWDKLESEGSSTWTVSMDAELPKKESSTTRK
jgi:hypothetical protein